MVVLFWAFLWVLLTLLVFMFPTFSLLMMLFFFAMLLGSRCFRLGWLSSFQDFTGLKVNVGKSEIASIGEVSNIHIWLIFFDAGWVVCL